jgi:hypothetical protein
MHRDIFMLGQLVTSWLSGRISAENDFPMPRRLQVVHFPLVSCKMCITPESGDVNPPPNWRSGVP